MPSGQIKNWLIPAALVGGFIAIISDMGLWEAVLRLLFPGEAQVLHPRANLLILVAEHLELVAASSSLTIIIGVPLGIWVTRSSGLGFQPLVNALTSLGQTFPPVAVLALAVPMLGFGALPTVAALFIYGLLPVVRNTISGLNNVPHAVIDSARGVGMSGIQTLLRVEIPVAAPVIIAGIRLSVVINIGTAMIGAVIGAGGLGSPIIAGLVQFNVAYIIEGALPAALLAILVDRLLANLENSFVYKPQRA